MPWVCKDCGETQSFYTRGTLTRVVRHEYLASQYINENGHETDLEEFDEFDQTNEDSEYEDDGDGVLCRNCDCEATEVDVEEWRRYDNGEIDVDGDDEDSSEPGNGRIRELKNKLLKGENK